MGLMRYKIYFFLFACNVFFGSIPTLYTIDDPIPYEEWKTASYERVAKEVAPVIIAHYKRQQTEEEFNCQKELIQTKASSIQNILNAVYTECSVNSGSCQNILDVIKRELDKATELDLQNILAVAKRAHRIEFPVIKLSSENQEQFFQNISNLIFCAAQGQSVQNILLKLSKQAPQNMFDGARKELFEVQKEFLQNTLDMLQGKVDKEDEKTLIKIQENFFQAQDKSNIDMLSTVIDEQIIYFQDLEKRLTTPLELFPDQLNFLIAQQAFLADQQNFNKAKDKSSCKDSLCDAQKTFIEHHLKFLAKKENLTYKVLQDILPQQFDLNQQKVFFENGEKLLEYQLINDIIKGIELRQATFDVPHISLARLVNNKNRKLVYYLPYIFISGSFGDNATKRLAKGQIFQYGLGTTEHIFAFIKSTNVARGRWLDFSHSERAIFETLLLLYLNGEKVLLSEGYILQIRNASPMCQDCQLFWLSECYKYLGQYADYGDVIDVWAELPFLLRIEVSRRLKKIANLVIDPTSIGEEEDDDE